MRNLYHNKVSMAVRLAADLRPSADRSAVRTWLSCRQPACLWPRAAARLGLGQTDGRIAVSLNAPPPTATDIIMLSLHTVASR